MAIQEVRDRLSRCTSALEAGQVPYAVVGGNAVAEWVGRVDKAAVRFTQDVDLLIRRSDLPRAIEVLSQAGFVYVTSFGVSFFWTAPTRILATPCVWFSAVKKSKNRMHSLLPTFPKRNAPSNSKSFRSMFW